MRGRVWSSCMRVRNSLRFRFRQLPDPTGSFCRIAPATGREPTDDDRVDDMALSIGVRNRHAGAVGPGRMLFRIAVAIQTHSTSNASSLLGVSAGRHPGRVGIALSVLLKIETNPSRLAPWRERYRRLQWLKVGDLRKNGRNTTPRACGRRAEVATMLAIAMQRGLWPPPPDWLPADPRMRALIHGEIR